MLYSKYIKSDFLAVIGTVEFHNRLVYKLTDKILSKIHEYYPEFIYNTTFIEDIRDSLVVTIFIYADMDNIIDKVITDFNTMVSKQYLHDLTLDSIDWSTSKYLNGLKSLHEFNKLYKLHPMYNAKIVSTFNARINAVNFYDEECYTGSIKILDLLGQHYKDIVYIDDLIRAVAQDVRVIFKDYGNLDDYLVLLDERMKDATSLKDIDFEGLPFKTLADYIRYEDDPSLYEIRIKADGSREYISYSNMEEEETWES